MRRAATDESLDFEVVVARYGMNDGVYQPLGKGRFAAFRESVKHLVDRCQAGGMNQVYLVTPPLYEPTPKAGEFNYDAVLAEYAKCEAGLTSPGVTVIDRHTACARPGTPAWSRSRRTRSTRATTATC